MTIGSHRHDEPLWSESWYADFADAAQGFGGWLRLGLIPNQQTAWLHALLCGPACPRSPWSLRGSGCPLIRGRCTRAQSISPHSADEPLRTYRIGAAGQGQSYQNPAGLLRAEPGTPAEVEIDLEWTTDGTPYQYRLATRYEIPCTVTGSVTIDGRRYTFDSVPGQRDHSWGVRDWWSMDWIWSALHLDDGRTCTRWTSKIPGVPPVSIGYIQNKRRDGHRVANHHSGYRHSTPMDCPSARRWRWSPEASRRPSTCTTWTATPGRPGRAGQPNSRGCGPP